MTQLEILERWYRDVWGNGDVAATVDLMLDAPPAVILAENAHLTAVDVATFAEIFRAHVSNIRCDFAKTISEGDWISALVNMSVTVNSTGQDVTFSETLFARIQDGKIAEAYSHFDQFKLFEALGALPEDTMSMCLMGETLS